MLRTSTSLISSVFLGSLVGLFGACATPGVGSVCESNEDCDDGLICDVHDGQGTCQEDHGHEAGHEAGDGDGDGDGDHGDETHGDTHDEEVDCAAETRDDDYEVGLSKSGAWATAMFVSADPAPPTLGDNAWVLSFTDDADGPLEGLSITVTPMMPDHGHGTPVVAEITPAETPGEYEIGPVNLFMAGFWEVTIDIEQGDQSDSLMFGFCVE